MAASFPLIGVWVENDKGVNRLFSTANLPGALGVCVDTALRHVADGAASASVREFVLDGAEKLLAIYDWRDLPENAAALD